MSSLRVLLTNWTLAGRHGSVLYVRDLALELLRQGHQPIVYSTEHGEVAQELQAATVPVVSSLDALGAPPDIIHGNHHPETMTALLRFPGVPAIHVCHAWGCWEAVPPRFPRLRRYIAVDDTCRDWLLGEHGIGPEQIQVLFNAVDLKRFAPRGPLPDRPRRALMFSNYAREDTYLPTVREACRRMDIALDIVGTGVGNPYPRPEEILGRYDLIFAKARCALEALATGAAVVLCEGGCLGPMVRAENWRPLRRLNFGRRAIREPLTGAALAQQINRYDPADAAEVSRQIRAAVGLESAVEEMVKLYEAVVTEQAAAGETDLRAEQLAGSAYLHWLTHHVHRGESRFQQAEAQRERARTDYDRLAAEYAASQAALRELQATFASLQAESEAMRLDRDRWQAECQRLQTAWDAAHAQQVHLQAECQMSWREREQWQRAHDAMRAERDRHHAAWQAIQDSTTVRLRNRLARLPGVGSLVRSLARRIRGVRSASKGSPILCGPAAQTHPAPAAAAEPADP
jgi:hypothetical protein